MNGHEHHHEVTLPEAISLLAGAIHALAQHNQPQSILCRIDQLENNIMSKLDDLVLAATTLSTSTDGLSVKVDTLITKIDAVVLALESVDLPPDAEAAVTALKAAAITAAAAGDKVDSEVTKLDTILPTPAPAGPV